jgi:hypothetical protein
VGSPVEVFNLFLSIALSTTRRLGVMSLDLTWIRTVQTYTEYPFVKRCLYSERYSSSGVCNYRIGFPSEEAENCIL